MESVIVMMGTNLLIVKEKLKKYLELYQLVENQIKISMGITKYLHGGKKGVLKYFSRVINRSIYINEHYKV